MKVYEVIARRFLSIFYPPAVYQKFSLDLERKKEHFFAGFRVLADQGYLKVADVSGQKKKTEQKEEPEGEKGTGKAGDKEKEESDQFQKNVDNPEFIKMLGVDRRYRIIFDYDPAYPKMLLQATASDPSQ